MRYLFMCLAAFMLLAVPAFASTTANVAVTVNVDGYCSLVIGTLANYAFVPVNCEDMDITNNLAIPELCCNHANGWNLQGNFVGGATWTPGLTVFGNGVALIDGAGPVNVASGVAGCYKASNTPPNAVAPVAVKVHMVYAQTLAKSYTGSLTITLVCL